jgi:ribosomal protein S27E
MKGRKKEEEEEIPVEIKLAYGLLSVSRDFSGLFEKTSTGLRCTVCGRLVENGGGLGALLSGAKTLHQECAWARKLARQLGIEELPVTLGPRGWECRYCKKPLAEEPRGHTLKSFMEKHDCCRRAKRAGIPLDAVHVERRCNSDRLFYWAVVCNVCGEEVDVDNGGWEEHKDKGCEERAETVTFLDKESGAPTLTPEGAEEPEELEELRQ